MKKLKSLFYNAGFYILILIAASLPALSQTIEIDYDFRSSASGWTVGFADYNPNNGTDFELFEGLRYMPRKLTRVPFRGFFIQGHNRSDDLFMFLKRRLAAEDGIVANRIYRIEYVIKFASNAPSSCFGVGGAPGEGVTLKAGAGPIEPLAVLLSDGYLRMNVDKGEQAIGGTAASVAGNIANGIPCAQAAPSYPFVLIQRAHVHTTNVPANASGELWLLIGTDSGFEGLTKLYYQSIKVRLIPV